MVRLWFKKAVFGVNQSLQEIRMKKCILRDLCCNSVLVDGVCIACQESRRNVQRAEEHKIAA
jgi:hypothetical protein